MLLPGATVPKLMRLPVERAIPAERAAPEHGNVAGDFAVEPNVAADDVDRRHLRNIASRRQRAVVGKIEVERVRARAAVDVAGDGSAANVDGVVAGSGVDIAGDQAAGVDDVVAAAGLDGQPIAADRAGVVDDDGLVQVSLPRTPMRSPVIVPQLFNVPPVLVNSTLVCRQTAVMVSRPGPGSMPALLMTTLLGWPSRSLTMIPSPPET